jgi:hypothetical protein
MSYRDDLAALTARHVALESEVAHKQRELAETTRLLEEARARARLPVLEQIQVAAPCRAAWAAMAGDDRVRHCGDCRRNVYNLSGMTRDEAEALIVAKEGRLCVRYFERADGTILFADDCGVGLERRGRRRRRVAIAGTAALVAGMAGAIAALVAEPDEHAPAQDELDLQRELSKHERLGKYDGVWPLPPPGRGPIFQ